MLKYIVRSIYGIAEASLIWIGVQSYIHVFGESLNDQGKAGVIFLGVFALFFLIKYLYLATFIKDKIGYVHVFEYMNQGFKEVHALSRNEDLQPDKILAIVSKVCNQ
jgi:uncharacterized protein YqhQ